MWSLTQRVRLCRYDLQGWLPRTRRVGFIRCDQVSHMAQGGVDGMARMKMPSFLFVDQDPLWLAALRRASRDLPGPKHFARNAEEALGLLRAHEPAVVVSGSKLRVS